MNHVQELQKEGERCVVRFMLANKREDFIGSAVLFVSSKQVFFKNIDIEHYICEVLNVEFKSYVFRSRTLLVAKICKIICDLDDDGFKEVKKKNKIYLKEMLSNRISDKKHFDLKKGKDNLDDWVNAILKN